MKTPLFSCEHQGCSYTGNQASLRQHKHRKHPEDIKKINKQPKYKCVCGKQYQHHSNYYKHRKACMLLKQMNSLQSDNPQDEIKKLLDLKNDDRPPILLQYDLTKKDFWKSVPRNWFFFTKNYFHAIVMDPPWDGTGLNLKYKTLADKQILKMPLKSLQKVGYLFLWVTNSKIEKGLQLLQRNGYKRAELIPWIKITPKGTLADGIGYYLRHNNEICLVGVKGKKRQLLEFSNLHRANNTIIAQRREQSRKPDELYQIVETLIPKGYYIELFGRSHNKRNKWVTVGDQIFKINY